MVYVIEYEYETYTFRSLDALVKALKSWWVADGRPYWYDSRGKRTHFPTKSEIEYALLTGPDFYRDYGTTNYIVITKVVLADTIM